MFSASQQSGRILLVLPIVFLLFIFRWVVTRRAFVALAVCCGCALAAASEFTANRYSTIPATPDGIGKSYLGREITQVMGWQGAQWLEREEREQEERGDLLLRELALKPGMDVMDVGGGNRLLRAAHCRAGRPQGQGLRDRCSTRDGRDA